VRRWLVVAALAACGDNALPVVDTRVEVVAMPATSTSKLDVVFVIGNGVSVLDHQVVLGEALPAWLAQISIDGQPDLHVAAITTDMGTSAAHGDPAPAIGGSINGCTSRGDNGAMFAWDASDHVLVDGPAATNHPDTLLRDLARTVDRGSAGCGYQQPLAALRAAFTNPLNAEFRRSDAALGIVVLSDTEDCSALDPSLFSTDTSVLGPLSSFRCTRFGIRCAEPDMTSYGPRTQCEPDPSSELVEDPTDFVDLARGQASDPRRVAFGAIIAPSDIAIEPRAPSGNPVPVPAVAHSCRWLDSSNSTEDANPALRLAWFAQQFGDRGAIGSICSDDVSPAATTMGINMRRAMGDPCIEDDVPLDHCTAVDEVDGVDAAVPPCGASSASCWELVTDPTTCPNAAHQKLVVHRIGAAPAGTYTLLRC